MSVLRTVLWFPRWLDVSGQLQL